jgi:hypothetical protein
MITFYQIHSLCQITHPPPIHHLAVDGTYYALRTTNPVGIGEHSDIIETIEKELEAMARYQDQLDILKKYFG